VGRARQQTWAVAGVDRANRPGTWGDSAGSSLSQRGQCQQACCSAEPKACAVQAGMWGRQGHVAGWDPTEEVGRASPALHLPPPTHAAAPLRGLGAGPDVEGWLQARRDSSSRKRSLARPLAVWPPAGGGAGAWLTRVGSRGCTAKRPSGDSHAYVVGPALRLEVRIHARAGLVSRGGAPPCASPNSTMWPAW
jgi:hypothetical protein